MTRTRSGNYHYYVCASSRMPRRAAGEGPETKNKACTTHCIQEKKLSCAVANTITSQIIVALELENELTRIKLLPSKLTSAAKLTAQLKDREQEIKSCENYKSSLYEDYKNDLISKEDYLLFGKDYSSRINKLKHAVAKLQAEIDLLINGYSCPAADEWLNRFTQPNGVVSLTRRLAVNFIIFRPLLNYIF